VKGEEANIATFSIDEHKDVAIVHEDEWCRIIVKPQGLATMGSDDRSLMKHSALLMPERFQIGVSYRKTIPCHRLDRATGGIVVCSKSKESELCIRLCFRYKLIQKRYCAIVSGNITSDEGMINLKVSGKDACTKYQVVNRSPSRQFGTITTVNLWPITGRRHQLRKHMQEFGHFILGDTRYSHAANWPNGIDRLFLWAVEVDLPHPNDVSLALHKMKVNIDDIANDIKNYDSENDDDDDQDDRLSKKLVGDQDAQGLEHKSDDVVPKDKKRKLSAVGNPDSTAMFVHQLSSLLEGSDRLKIQIDEPKYYQEFRMKS
jgi:23S rRNA-/tRNA-specific pseudouridylate synthase